MGIFDKAGQFISHAWNAFTAQEERETRVKTYNNGYNVSYSSAPDRTRLRTTSDRGLLQAALMRVAIDAAMSDILHVRLDENKMFVEEMSSGLNDCLTVAANIDQEARAFRQDMIASMLEHGHVAIVPVDMATRPDQSGGKWILSMRIGRVTAWFPEEVIVRVWNHHISDYQEITMDKKDVAIAYNPMYQVMNEPNSTLQRLLRKLNLLDIVDEQQSSGKLDIIIQLPYVLKTEAKKDEARKRSKDIEDQLKGSKYGVAYTEASEKITQLNRPAENTLVQQVKDLKAEFYDQLGITSAVINGTADEAAMLLYNTRTVEPILSAVTEAMKHKFLTKTARSQRQSIEHYRDPFKLVPVSQIAEIADKMTRNEILTPNEVRGIIGFKPSTSPRANELMNRNISAPVGALPEPEEEQITMKQIR